MADSAATVGSATQGGDATEPDGAGGVYAALRATRPRIRRDVLFTETPGGVLFHNADGGFHLTGRTAYRFAALIIPHLTGRHTLGELCAGFGAAQRTMAAALVKTLYERSFARDVPEADLTASAASAAGQAVDRRFAAQIAYIDHYADGAPGRFARFRETAVAVLGHDDTARWCALSLVRNGCARLAVAADFPDVTAEAAEATGDGCPTRVDRVAADAGWDALAGYDVVVVTGPGAAVRTHRLLACGVPEGRTLIPAWTFGDRAATGPLATAASAGCWCCAVLRLAGNVDAGAAAEIWSEVAAGAVPSPAAPLAGPVAAMAGNLLGYEVFRLASGALPAETGGQVLLQDLGSLDVVAEPVQPHPRCRRCSTLPGAAAPPAAPPPALALPETPTVETAGEAEAVVAELNRIGSLLVRPSTGVFARYLDEKLTQAPLKVSRVEVALGPGSRRRIAAFDVHHLAGARTRALHAAARVYVEHLVPPAPAGAEPPEQVARLEPRALATGGLTDVPAEAVGAWRTATSLLTKETAAVPAAAVQPFSAANRDRLHLATGAGSAAGATAREAAGRGLLDALAHDALLRALRGAARVAPLAADAGDPELVFLFKSATNLGIGAELLDLGEGERSAASVVLARETGADGAARWAIGAGLSPAGAARDALRDLLGQVQLAAQDPSQEVDPGLPFAEDLAPETIAVTADAPAGSGPVGFDAVLDRLRSAGRDAFYVATTPADLAAGGISTARILLTADPEGAPDARG